MDTHSAVELLAKPINHFGARFMLDPITFSRSAELGLPASLASYVHGRLGVMGDIDVETAIDNMFFFDKNLVAATWNEPSDLSKTQAGAAYTSICAERGRLYLEGFKDAKRLAALLERVADTADDAQAALFAGWRDASRPDDGPGRAYLLLAVVRELRGCRHMSVCRAADSDPLALVLAQGGEGTARLHGYQNLDHEPASVDQLASIEAATHAADAKNYSCLSDSDRSELVTLVQNAVTHAADQ